MKTLVTLLLVLLCLLPETQSLAGESNYFDKFMDDKRKGLLLGLELGYGVGTAQYNFSTPDSTSTPEDSDIWDDSLYGTLARVKFGYGLSENLALYMAGAIGNTNSLDLGAMLFFQQSSPSFYLDGSVGYYDLDLEDSNFYGLRLGGGYEFRPHFMIEAGMQYIQGSAPVLGQLHIDISARVFFVSINYLSY